MLQYSPSTSQLIHVENQPPFARSPGLVRLLSSPFCSQRSSPAEARRLFCVSSAHPNGGGAAPFGTLLPTAQSSQPRMTDRRLIPLARRCLTDYAGRPSSHSPNQTPASSVRACWPGPDEPMDALGWASTPTRCGEITAHRLPPLAVACRVRRYAGVVVDALSFFPPAQGGAKYYVSPRNYSV